MIYNIYVNEILQKIFTYFVVKCKREIIGVDKNEL